MGRRGPPPKPREQRIAEGKPGHRPLPAPVLVGERVADVAPAAPSHLGELAVAVWDELAPMLFDAGMLTVSDLVMLEGLCVVVARARRAGRELEGEELVSSGAQSQRIVNPLVRIERDAWAQALRLAQEFGLTPSARARFGLTVVKGRSLQADLQQRLGGVDVPKTVTVPAEAPASRRRKKPVARGAAK